MGKIFSSLSGVREKRGLSDARISVLPALGLLKEECGAPRGAKWGRTGSAPGWKVGRRQLRTHRHPDLDHQGAARGGQWGGTGGGSGWKVGTREQDGEDGGKQPSLPRWLSTHSPGWKVGTIRERPGVESGGAQGLSAHSWAQRSLLSTALTPGHSTRPHVGHTPITMRTAGHDHGYKSDTTPAQHAKTRLRSEVTSTIHDTVFDLWTTQAQGRTQQSQGRTYNAHSQNPGFQIRAKLSDGPALANDAPDPQGSSPRNSVDASPSSSEKEPHCLSAKRSRTTRHRPSK